MQGRTSAFRWRTAARAAAASLICAAGLAGPARAAQGELSPFEASFTVEWHGMSAGTAKLALRKTDAQHWLYTSEQSARGLFRLYAANTLHQSSEVRIEDGHIVPQHFINEDGTDKTDKDSDVRFDWKANRATGTSEGRKVDVELEPGTQDTLSVQIALIQELVAGRTPTKFVLLDRDEVKDYDYTAEGNERVQTALGSHETKIFRSKRADSDRSTLFWCAPDLGWLPVKVERHRTTKNDKGEKVEWSMKITSLTRE
jgi:hypothetical protein